MVVGDVVRLANRVRVIESKQEPFDDVGDVDEGKRIASFADDDPFSIRESVRHPAKVQLVAGAEEGSWADDDGWEMLVDDHLLDDAISLRLRDCIGLTKGPQEEVYASGLG